MLRNILLLLTLLTIIFIKITWASTLVSGYLKSSDEAEIKNIVISAIEDTSWFQASTRQEVRKLLAVYYGEPLLSELSGSVWKFICVPTDWHYETRSGRLTILELTGNQAELQVEIVETEALSGSSIVSNVKYLLAKSDHKWKIVGINPGSAP
ncbi:MAG: hypothetical protein BWY80_00936 [Firmicutes bacterium ADurb.Bin456]|nr:MAG: hypothetical protein BWY80_00936 [Firmicutes bacterium ADurb.Bin456]